RKGRGGGEWVAARMIFRFLGIDREGEMRAVALGSASGRLAALRGGVIDVAVFSPPADEEGRKVGFNIVARAYELFTFPFVGLGTHTRKIKEKPDEVRRTLKALIKANRFIRQNREGTIQTLAEWGRTTPELAAAAYDSSWKVFNLDGSIPEEGMRSVIDQAVKEAKGTRESLATGESDLGPLRDAQKELGIKGR